MANAAPVATTAAISWRARRFIPAQCTPDREPCPRAAARFRLEALRPLEQWLSSGKELWGERAALDQFAASMTPLERFAAADEIAGLISFLLSDAAGNMTGSLVVSDGGYTL
jgi:NAD(P)-dependent dehydrogenase (short-subunit alcohol dehydrogenase family)